MPWLSPQRVPTLDFTDADKKETDYTWDAATGHIVTEKGPQGSWTYQIGDVDAPSGTPPIFRTNANTASAPTANGNHLMVERIFA